MKKIGLVSLISLIGLLSGCKSSNERFGSLLYERTLDPSGGVIQERYVLNGRGKDAEEVYRRFDQIYEKTNQEGLYRRGIFIPNRTGNPKQPTEL